MRKSLCTGALDEHMLLSSSVMCEEAVQEHYMRKASVYSSTFEGASQ